ncbi:hypothetical protein [Mycolicibacterium tusciae]|uniref:hypothetical protein n=1 Tax=Mycolicibacterium tusciae TaxID=75922 RepID=UPI00024A31F8|nr:hypothetical protein [Mycolicibacterium tusciae]
MQSEGVDKRAIAIEEDYAPPGLQPAEVLANLASILNWPESRTSWKTLAQADNAAARALLDTAPISPVDREKLAHGTVGALLRV